MIKKKNTKMKKRIKNDEVEGERNNKEAEERRKLGKEVNGFVGDEDFKGGEEQGQVQETEH